MNLLDHDWNILVQIAAVKLNNIHKYMEEVRRQTDVHPQEDKTG